MMTEEMMKQMPHMMGSGMGSMGSSMMGHPVAQGAMMAATGFAAGRGLLGASLLRNPLVLLAAGVAAGYLLHKYEKEIVAAVAKATGMGKDFVLEQKENLSDLVAEAQEKEAQQGQPAA
jgi:hypothetical protein